MYAPLTGPHGQDSGRIEFSRLSRRILHNEHEGDVRSRLVGRIGEFRSSQTPTLDLSRNALRHTMMALGSLYDLEPTVEGDPETLKLADSGGLWPLMATACPQVLALRDLWLKVDVSKCEYTDELQVAYVTIPPDLVCVRPRRDRPTEPEVVWVAVERERVGAQGTCWTWDEYDISGPEPTYRVLRLRDAGSQLYVPGNTVPSSELEDVSELYRDEPGTWPAQWTDGAGRPVLPLVHYTATRTSHIYGDAYGLLTLVTGTLDVCVQMANYQHTSDTCSWTQRVSIGLRPADAVDGYHLADPAHVLSMLPIDGFRGQPSFQTIPPAIKPMESLEAIDRYEQSLLIASGINPADVTRASAGQPGSGQALTIKRDAQRAAQRRYIPQFRRSDAQTLAVTAMQANRIQGSSWDESGYVVRYHGIPQTSEERAADRREVLDLLDRKLIAASDAYRKLNPTVASEAEATEALTRIRRSEEAPRTSLSGPQTKALQDLAMAAAAGQLPARAAMRLAAIALPDVPASEIQSAFTGLDDFVAPQEN